MVFDVAGMVEAVALEVAGLMEPVTPEVQGAVEPMTPEVQGAVEPVTPEVQGAVEPVASEVQGVVEPTLEPAVAALEPCSVVDLEPIVAPVASEDLPTPGVRADAEPSAAGVGSRRQREADREGNGKRETGPFQACSPIRWSNQAPYHALSPRSNPFTYYNAKGGPLIPTRTKS